MSDLVWTKTKPTEPGWYWVLCWNFARPQWFDGDVFWDGQAKVKAEGIKNAGPIPLPAEPFDETVTEKDIGTMVEVSNVDGDRADRRELLAVLPEDIKGSRYICRCWPEKHAWIAWCHARRIREKS